MGHSKKLKFKAGAKEASAHLMGNSEEEMALQRFLELRQEAECLSPLGVSATHHSNQQR